MSFMTYWQCLQFSSLPSGFSSGSTATSSPFPFTVKVSPLEKMFSDTLTVDVVVTDEDDDESVKVGKGDDGDEGVEEVSTCSISLQ